MIRWYPVRSPLVFVQLPVIIAHSLLGKEYESLLLIVVPAQQVDTAPSCTNQSFALTRRTKNDTYTDVLQTKFLWHFFDFLKCSNPWSSMHFWVHIEGCTVCARRCNMAARSCKSNLAREKPYQLRLLKSFFGSDCVRAKERQHMRVFAIVV